MLSTSGSSLGKEGVGGSEQGLLQEDRHSRVTHTWLVGRIASVWVGLQVWCDGSSGREDRKNESEEVRRLVERTSLEGTCKPRQGIRILPHVQ